MTRTQRTITELAVALATLIAISGDLTAQVSQGKSGYLDRPGQLPRQARNPVDLPPHRCGYDEEFRVCDRRAERPEIEATNGVVRRFGDTLRVVTRSAVVTWIDTPDDGTGRARHYYVGTLDAGRRRFAVVRRDMYESAEFVLVSAVSGDTIVVPGAPLVSPDRRRVVASTVGDDTDFTLAVWRVDADVPVREFTTTFSDHMPIDHVWTDSVTIGFRLRFRPLGGPFDPNPPRRVTLMRAGTGEWRLDSLLRDRPRR